MSAHPEPLTVVEPSFTAINAPVDEALTFRGHCPVCPWEGRDRRSSLSALIDYDRHAQLAEHQLAVWAAASAPEDPDDDYNPA